VGALEQRQECAQAVETGAGARPGIGVRGAVLGHLASWTGAGPSGPGRAGARPAAASPGQAAAPPAAPSGAGAGAGADSGRPTPTCGPCCNLLPCWASPGRARPT